MVFVWIDFVWFWCLLLLVLRLIIWCLSRLCFGCLGLRFCLVFVFAVGMCLVLIVLLRFAFYWCGLRKLTSCFVVCFSCVGYCSLCFALGVTCLFSGLFSCLMCCLGCSFEWVLIGCDLMVFAWAEFGCFVERNFGCFRLCVVLLADVVSLGLV